MFEPEIATFLGGGRAFIVATVGDANEPHATRGWGLELVDGPRIDGGRSRRVRLLLDADDVCALEHVRSGRRIAITGADVRTLRSVQLKGRAVGLEDAGPDDEARAARYCDDFFGDITAIDGIERGVLERLVPSRYAACAVDVEELYDQTPGPGAGAPLGTSAP